MRHWLLCLCVVVPGPGVADTSLDVGGFLRIYAMTSNIPLDRQTRVAQRLWVPQIPLEGANIAGGQRTNLHARESRLWLTASTPLSAAGGETFNAYIEYDLNESALDHRPRLRHAYVSVGPLLAGQTYTTFTNTTALADIEAAIAVGNIVTRQPMVRWTQSLPAEGLQLSIALEAARTRSISQTEAGIRQDQQDTPPDLVLRLDHAWAGGNWSVAGISRRITVGDPGQETHSRR